ncbi:Nuclear RNA export factor 2 [Manis javanica]|nr:Nuclear RNA export factor 2 [Manis javanica]
METMLCFSVNGVFKEVEGTFQGSVRAFTRAFITTPASGSSVSQEAAVGSQSSLSSLAE